MAHVFQGDADLPGRAWMAMVLSIIPGLGHLVCGRRRAAAVCFVAWVVGVVVCVNFYHGAVGGLLLSFVCLWPAVTAFDAAEVRRHARLPGDRIRIMMHLVSVGSLAFMLVLIMVRRHLPMFPAPFPVPAHNIQTDDVLLVSRSETAARPGDFVMVAPSPDRWAVQMGGNLYLQLPREAWFGLCVAAGKSRVRITPDGLVVAGRLVQPEAFGDGVIPLPKKAFDVYLSDTDILVITPLKMPDDEPADHVGKEIWNRFYRVSRDKIQGRAAAVYLPLRRRHRIQRREVLHEQSIQ